MLDWFYLNNTQSLKMVLEQIKHLIEKQGS